MWYCWKHKPSASTTLETVWSALKAAGLAYIPILTSTSTSTPNGSDVEVDGSAGDSEKDRMEDKMPTVVKHVLDGERSFIFAHLIVKGDYFSSPECLFPTISFPS